MMRSAFWTHCVRVVLLLIILDFARVEEAFAQRNDRAAERGGAAPDAVTVADDTEIVVTARYGDANVAPETELDEEDIAIHGASSIAELLQSLKPSIDGSGEELELLVNGKRGGAVGVSGFPPEALSRLAILPPDAAARYGYPPGRRVVNLVLKRKFSSLSIDAGASFATAGGRDGQRLSAGYTAISGQTNWGVNAQLSRESALLKNQRHIPRPGAAVDLAGHIEGLGLGEIDPQLSALAGKAVTIAGVPRGAESDPPELSNFVQTAGVVQLGDPHAYETLLPGNETLSLSANLTRPIGAFSGSISVNGGTNRTERLLGLPRTSAVLPAASFWSPFHQDVVLVRSYDGDRPLRSRLQSRSWGVSTSLSGAIGSWQLNLLANYMRGSSRSSLDRGIDITEFQKIVSSGDILKNPYGRLPKEIFLTDEIYSLYENWDAQINVSNSIFEIKSGSVFLNFTASANRNFSSNKLIKSNSTFENSHARNMRFKVQQSFTIPISSRSADERAVLGDLSIDVLGSLDIGGEGEVQRAFDGRVNWTPWPSVQLRGSISYTEDVPAVVLLEGPRVETINRVYDFIRQEVAEPVWITGGNPALRRGARHAFTLNGTFYPLSREGPTLNVSYQRVTGRRGSGALPTSAPSVEAVFPERFTRDDAGRLIMVDARPINIARNSLEALTTSLVVRLLSERQPAAAVPQNPLRLNMSLNHVWQLKNELLIRNGIAVLDQLNGAGQARHHASLQLTAGKKGLGATLSGNWVGPARLDGADDVFHFKSSLKFNFSTFFEPHRLIGSGNEDSVFKNLRISFDVQNIFNEFRRVELNDGSVPYGYGRDEIDPVGRLIRFSIQKRF